MTASPCASRTLAILGPRTRLRRRSRLGPDAGGRRRGHHRRRGRRRRPLPLAGLRAALLRDDGQLHGPPDPLAAEANPRQRAHVDQRPVRDGQRGLSGGLRGWSALLRRTHRSRRHQDRVRRLHRRLEPGGHGARAGRERERLLRRARRARARRGGELPLGRSRRSPSGSRPASGPTPPRSSTAAATSAPSSRRRSSPGWPLTSAGARRSWPPGSPGSSGWRSGSPGTTSPSGSPSSPPPSWPTSRSQDAGAAPTVRAEARISWPEILRHRQAWAFIVAKFLTDPVWWFFLIWLPDYFKKTRGLAIKDSWVYLVTIYSIVTVLSIFGGWLSGFLTAPRDAA